MSLSEKELHALDRILDMLLPQSIPELGFFNAFYSKEGTKKKLIEEAVKDPLTSIKIRNVFTILKQIFE